MTKEELVKIETIENETQAESLLGFLASDNDKTFNRTKLLEELLELSERIAKSLNKKPEYQPTQQDIVEEIGDVLLRLQIYIRSEDISEDLIVDRTFLKINKFLEYLKNNQYANGI